MESCSSCTLFLSLNQITFILPVRATLLCTFSTVINNSSEPTEISSYMCILKKVLSKFRLSKCHLNPLFHTKVDSWCPMDVNWWISVYKPDLSCFYAFCKEIYLMWMSTATVFARIMRKKIFLCSLLCNYPRWFQKKEGERISALILQDLCQFYVFYAQ